MHAAPRRTRTITPVAVMCVVVLALLATALPAVANGMTFTPPNPVAGDSVTVTGSSRECENNLAQNDTFTFARHNADTTQTVTSSGQGTFGPNGPYYSATVPQAGTYTATEDAQCPQNTGYPVDEYTSVDFTVGTGLGGSITASPDPAIVNQPVALNATPDGGNPGYTFAWDLNHDGTFTDATTHSASTTFTTTGPHVVSVKITDTGAGGNPAHTATITRTINVVTPPAPPTTTGTTTTATTTTPAPAPCVPRLAFKLSEFTTTGCFTEISSSPERWTTTSAVKLNGISLPDYGQTFTITEPTAGEPGGHFSAPNSTMQLDGFTAFSGNIDWSLPDGGPGQEQVVPGRSFAVAAGATLAGLQVRGSIALELGEDSDGTYYADFPLSIQLPAAFSAGPDPEFGSVTGAASLRVDDAGVHYNGLKLQAENVWLGKIKVDSVCFSYIPSGGMSTAPCDTPTFGRDPSLLAQPGGDQPFIQCGTDPTTNRWDANAQIELPSGLQLGAFGGMANGQISKLGANLGNLGRRVPLAEGVYLDHIAFGMCLSPPPFKIKANVGANFLGNNNLVAVDGSFTYTDAVGYTPWSLELDGAVTVGDLPIGSGTLGFTGAGVVNFGLKAGVNVLGGAASLSAEVDGWIDAPHNQFVVAGDGQGCLGTACAKAEGELSSKGVAGCVTVGTSTPSYDLVIPLDGSPVHLDTSTYPLTAGFGYVWGASSVALLGGSCDFSPYQPTRPAGLAAAASSGVGVRIAGNTDAVSLRIHGTHGPPKVVVHGPRGATIASPSRGNATLRKGHYLLVENKTDGTTDVMLVRPAAGTWTVSAARGSASSPTKIDRATLQVPPTFGARVLGKSGSRTVRVAYAVPARTSVRLVEHAKGINHTIATRLRGRRCAGLPAMRPGTDEKILCTNIRFRPAFGPGGRRTVQAVVTRAGIPLLQKTVASFRAPRLTMPSRVAKLRAQRSKGNLVIAFSPSAGASRYSVSAKLTDGRALAFDLGPSCRALRIAKVPSAVGAAVKVAGVRFDLAMGHARAISIKANARAAGSTTKKLRLGKVCK